MRKYILKSWFGTRDFRNTGSLVCGVLARGHWPLWEDQAVLSPEKKEVPVLSTCVRLIMCYEQSSLCSSQSDLSQPLDLYDFVAWFHGVLTCTLKLIKPSRFCIMQIFLCLICLSSRSHQLTGLLGCPGFFSPWYAYLKVASFFAPLSAYMLPKNPCQPDLHCGVNKQNWSLGPFFLNPHLKSFIRKLSLKPYLTP